MKKLKMIVTSVVVLVIIGSVFALNAKKIAIFCTSGDLNSTSCDKITSSVKKGNCTRNAYYVADWDGAVCNGQTCTASACFRQD